MDEGNIKLVQPTKDKNVETVYQLPDRQLRVIKESSDFVKTSSLEGRELCSEKREINSEVKKFDAD